MAGTIVKVCVYFLSKRSTLLPWMIVSVTDDQHSFTEFYTSNIQPNVAGSSETSYDVESAQDGPCKDCLNMVDLGLQVCQVVENFGHYVKYVVNCSRSLLTTLTLVELLELMELNLGNSLKEVEVGDHVFGDPVETLYYSAGFEPVCVYCARDQPFTCDEQYPQCPDCSHCPAVKN